MQPAHLYTQALELTNQHAVAHKGGLQVQLVKLTHGRQMCRTERARFVVHRASADLEKFGLLAQSKRIVWVNHHLALSNPALPLWLSLSAWL